MITFGTLQRDGNLTNVREISHESLRQCPHTIFVADHYRPDGTCKCDAPEETIMRTWGYRWSKKLGRWIA